MDKMTIWNKVKQPPKDALKSITGGRLKGMTDIKPQWRLQVMTEIFGPCGIGWKYEIVEMWPVHLESGEATAFARINLFVKENDEWSEPIPGVGGSMLVAKEKSGLYVSDEAYKMALTDALSVAMKALGVAADIYSGLWDGSKYRELPQNPPEKVTIPRDVMQKVIEQSLEALTEADPIKLHEAWDGFSAEEKVVLWSKFNSQQRAAMKELQKEMAA